jgi:PKD repeat protein
MKSIKKKVFALTLSLVLLGAIAIVPVRAGSNAELSLSPSTKTVGIGETFGVDVLVNTNNQNVNTVAAYLTYDATKLQVVNIDTTKSIFTMEAEKTFDSNTGKIKISRGKPTPGVNTANGNVATINFKALSPASPTTVDFVMTAKGVHGDSDINLDDGKGTDILASVKNGSYTITSAGVVPPTCVINANPISGAAPLSVSFSTAGSVDSDGAITSNSWNFGDGSPATGGPNVKHTYTAAGTYTAVLSLTDNDGATSSCSKIIAVTAPTTGPATSALIIIGILAATIYFAYKKGWVPTGKATDK